LENIDDVRFSCTSDMKFFKYLTTTDDEDLPNCSLLPLVIAYFNVFRANELVTEQDKIELNIITFIFHPFLEVNSSY